MIRLWKSIDQGVKANPVDQCFWDGSAYDALPTWQIVEQVRTFKLSLEIVERTRELIRDLGSWLCSLKTGMLTPDALEFGGGVLRDFGLDILDIALIELGRLSILEDHEINVFLG